MAVWGIEDDDTEDEGPRTQPSPLSAPVTDRRPAVEVELTVAERIARYLADRE